MASVYKRGKVWYYEVCISNKRYQGSTRTADKRLAQTFANSLETDLVRRKFNIPTNASKKSFQECYQEYLKGILHSETWMREKTHTSPAHFMPVFKNMNVADIDRSAIKAYQLKRKREIMAMPKNDGKKESEISFKSINMEISILSNFFNFCIEAGYITQNPALKIRKLNELSRLKTLSDESIKKLIGGATNKLTKDLIAFLIYTGCRKGEALNLKWNDVDLENNIIAVKATKTSHDRYMPVSEPLKELLVGIGRIDGCDYVFNINGRKVGNFRKSFATACRNAGLKDICIHDLRHVFASKMVMNGTSLFITGELLGHRTTQMTKRYSHLVPDTLRKAVNDVFMKKK